MGGNGQFNRLAALDAIADGDGPWRNRLTEDQDLGLRLLAAGWKSHQEMRAVVEQQGVPRLRPLLRQRTRWAQGNLQAFGLLGAMWRSPFPRSARAGEVLYLMMPLWQAIVGAAFVCAIVLAALGIASVIPSAEILPEVYVLGFSNSVLGCLATRRTAGRGRLRSILVAHLYAVYTWLLFPVLVRALLRQIGIAPRMVAHRPRGARARCGHGRCRRVSRGIARGLDAASAPPSRCRAYHSAAATAAWPSSDRSL